MGRLLRVAETADLPVCSMRIVQNITFSITDQLSLSCKVSDLMLLENKDAKRNYHVKPAIVVPTPNGKSLEKCLYIYCHMVRTLWE